MPRPVVLRRPATRSPSKKRGAATPRRMVRSARTSRRHGRSLLLVALLIVVGVGLAVRKSTGERGRYGAPLSASGRYVSLPHPATAEMKRQAAYLARLHELPLIAEPGAARVEIRRFK
jgi:hypothetical protein